MNLNEKDLGDVYLSPKTRRRIFASVLSLHGIFIIGPLVVFMIAEHFKPHQLPVISVGITNFIPGDSGGGAPMMESRSNNSQQEEASVLPDPTVSDISSLPVIPDPPPVVVPPPPVTPPVQIRPVDPVPVADAPPTNNKPPKPTQGRTILRPDQINTDARIVTVPGSQRTTNQSRSNELTKAIELIDTRISISGGPGFGPGPGGPGGGSQSEWDSFRAKLSAYVKSCWVKPSAGELGGKKPFAVLKLDIDKNGNITGSKIITKSGISAMDSSVERLRQVLTTLPKPPEAVKGLTITLQID